MNDWAGKNSSVEIGIFAKNVRDGSTILRPKFQRKSIWSDRDKVFFIDTILKRFPFPEVFFTTGYQGINPVQNVVDGQQRLTTIIEYLDGRMKIEARGSGGNKIAVPAFTDLNDSRKMEFLSYPIAVRNLGNIDEKQLRDIFQRINATDYALKSGEKMHALFGGEFQQFCVALARNEFWAKHRVFSKAKARRMYDTSFCVVLVITMLSGYYRRSEKNFDFLERYNSSFPQAEDVKSRMDRVFSFLTDCKIPDASRAWKLTDLLTLVVESDQVLECGTPALNAESVGTRLTGFYNAVDAMFKDMGSRAVDAERPEGDPLLDGWAKTELLAYIKASTKASDDKYQRQQRAVIVRSLLER